MNRFQKVGLIVGVSVILLGSFILIPYFLGSQENESVYQLDTIDYAKITVLIDNNPNGTLNSPWGLSILVETTDLTILFDSGPDQTALAENSASLGVDFVSTYDLGVISHGHPDHVDGLGYISDSRDNFTLYTPFYGFTKHWMDDFNIIEVGNTTEISAGIAVIQVDYEVALVVNIENLGMVVLVGCSHPGVENLVAKAIDDLNVDDIYMVMGGFHLGQAEQDVIEDTANALINQGVQNIIPLHCTGENFKDYLQTNYNANYVEASVGFQVVLNGAAQLSH